mmetsp:Transcript_13360/g.19105  ORF Transcript_13360/g.19105 Transcript_13360/m.19105 type:complete len:594 (+) Transcript_13360:176-1957(+)
MTPEYLPPIYDSNNIIDHFRASPRFGHNDDISRLFSNNSKERYDYVLGTIFIASFLGSIFLLWFLILAIFSMCGPKCAGFLTGSNMKESRPDNFSQTKPFRTPYAVRIVFSLSSVLALSSSILLIFFGFTASMDTIHDINQDLKEINILSEQARQIVDNTIRDRERSSFKRDVVIDDLTLASFCTQNLIPKESRIENLRLELNEKLQNFEYINTTYFQELKTNIFQVVERKTSQIINAVETYNIQKWQILSISITFSVITTLMMSGVFLAWKNKISTRYICFLTWIILPVYMVLIFFNGVFCIFVGSFAIYLSDFCSSNISHGGPEGAFSGILKESTLDATNPLLFSGLTYYLNRCQPLFPFQLLENHVKDITVVLDSAEEFVNEFDSFDIYNLSESCGSNELSTLTRLRSNLGQLMEYLVAASENSSNIHNILKCDRIVPIFIDAAHISMCSELPTSIVWLFSCLLIISVMGMLMITLRSAWLDVSYAKRYLADSVIEISMPSSSYDEKIIAKDDKTELIFRNDSSPSTVGKENNVDYENHVETSLCSSKSWENHPNSIDNGRSWESVSVADENAIRLTLSSTSNPTNFRIY